MSRQAYTPLLIILNVLVVIVLGGYIVLLNTSKNDDLVSNTASQESDTMQVIEEGEALEQGIVSISRSIDRAVRMVTIFCSKANYQADTCELFAMQDGGRRQSLGLKQFGLPGSESETDVSWELSLDEYGNHELEAILYFAGQPVKTDTFTLE